LFQQRGVAFADRQLADAQLDFGFSLLRA
jgi:hypothetical protein